MNEKITILTEELIKAKADLDFETDVEKWDYIATLESKILEELK